MKARPVQSVQDGLVRGSTPAGCTFRQMKSPRNRIIINTHLGFTLVELLVVISIIGVLSSIIFVAVNSVRAKANYAKVKAELNQFIKTAIITQGEASKTLRNITGSGCSDCACRSRDIRNILTSDSCYTQWINALTMIQNASGTVAGLSGMTRDPWGSPYGLDENERESGPPDCRQDTIRSAGPDGILYNPDDLGYSIPFSSPCP